VQLGAAEGATFVANGTGNVETPREIHSCTSLAWPIRGVRTRRFCGLAFHGKSWREVMVAGVVGRKPGSASACLIACHYPMAGIAPP